MSLPQSDGAAGPDVSLRIDASAEGGPVGVLMLTKGLGLGGTERLIAGAVRHLDPTRYRPEVAYLLPWKDALASEIRGAGVPVHCLDAPHVTSVAWIARLRRLVREHDIGIVHTHMPLPAIAARLTLIGDRPVIVHTEHNLWPRYRPVTRWANRVTYRRNRAVIAVSAGVAGTIRSRVPVEVVHHGADADRTRRDGGARANARALLALDAGDLVVGTVGNMTVKKDHDTLLRAFSLVCRELPSTRLVLVGSGPLEGAVRALVAELGLGACVILAGSRRDVPDLLPAFDVFALSSRFEGLPIALLEAMASGVACVATTVGGITEVLTDGRDGLLVGPEDPAALAGAIVELLRSPRRRLELARAGIARAAEFDLAGAVRKIEHVYDGALGRC